MINQNSDTHIIDFVFNNPYNFFLISKHNRFSFLNVNVVLSCPGQGRGSAAGLSGAGGCVGESRGPVPLLWDRGPNRQTLLQHEGLPPHLLERSTDGLL